jgi:peptidoglycan-N-acetylglucosamine deacetylase
VIRSDPGDLGGYPLRIPTYRFLRKLVEAGARRVLGAVTHVATHEAVAALTFDDGPHPEYTPLLLDILETYQVRAIFFMVGAAARKHSELVKQVGEKGHAIGNHSWDHPSFPSITGRQRREQLRDCANAIAPYGQKIFRPPSGVQDAASRLDAWRLRYKIVGWNVDAEDWIAHAPDWMADRIISNIRPGSIILLHDAIFRSSQKVPQYNREPMLKAVNIFLEQLGGRLRFVTVTELLRCGRPISDESHM